MIKQTTDYEMIKDMLLNDAELYERISDDYTKPEKFDPSLQDWLGWFEENDCKALLSAHKETESVMVIHMHIPKKNRGKDSFKIGNGLVEHLEQNSPERFVKINIKIPDMNIDVVKFAEKCGFTTEGIDKKSFLKNGKYYDRVMMGKIIERKT